MLQMTMVVGVVMVVFAAGRSAAQEGTNCGLEGQAPVMQPGNLFNGPRCVLDPVGDRDTVRFTGSPGDVVSIYVAEREGNSIEPCVILLDPDGQQASSKCAGDGVHLNEDSVHLIATLAKDGAYRVRVHDDGDNAAGAYSVAFHRLNPAPPTTPVLTVGAEILDAIDGRGDVDHYVFEGTAGGSLSIEVTENGSSVLLCVSVFDPNGVLSQAEVCDNSPIVVGVSITQTGTWSALVREFDNDRGAYAIRLTGPDICDGLPVTVIGTSGDDVLTGTEGDDVINGLGGNDVINGLGGNDHICGGPGHDVILGGAGNDRIFGGPGNDSIDGGPGADRIFGDFGNDTLTGGAGNDVISGGSGHDVLSGDTGNDSLIGGIGVDVCAGGEEVTGDTADASCEEVLQVP